MVTEIKDLPPDVKEFTANGRRYIVHETLTADGFQMMEELRLEIETGTTAAELVKTIGKAINSLNNGAKLFDACNHLYNATSSAERIQQKIPHPLLLTLTLFVRPEGSDLSTWNPAEAATWIQDFNEEGYNINSLFIKADACREGFVSNFTRNSPDIFQTEEESEEATEQQAEAVDSKRKSRQKRS